MCCRPWRHKESDTTGQVNSNNNQDSVVITVQSPSWDQLFEMPWTAAHQASLSLLYFKPPSFRLCRWNLGKIDGSCQKGENS